MTPREKFILALQGHQPPGRVPHFELVFYLTMEAFNRVHPLHRHFAQWDQMSPAERNLHIRDIADLYVATARNYYNSAIFFHEPSGWKNQRLDNVKMTLDSIREISGMDYFLMMHGDATYAIPDGENMVRFAHDIADHPQKLKDHAQHRVDETLQTAQSLQSHGALDGFALCSDYCFNDNPFLSPAMFDEFITPYLARLTTGLRDMGFYVIKHTDGNIMPILDSLISTRPHALHSLDPQAGIDIAHLKRLVGDQVCLIGNVNCGLMDTGSDAQVIESARYALRHGMPNGGYIFSTSNCIYTGMSLNRYQLILDTWRNEGNYS